MNFNHLKNNFLQLFKSKKISPKALILMGISVALASTIATFIFLSGKKITSDIQPNDEKLESEALAQEYVNDQKTTFDGRNLNILLLGYGGAGHSGGFLTDVIQIVHFDFETQKIAFISIPRDLWVQLPNGKSDKINKAFTLGVSSDPINSGAEISKQMVATITGLNINYFFSIDFVGFKRAIGSELKGLDVNVPETLDDPWYPISGNELETCGKTPEEVAELSSQLSGFELEKQFECRYERIYFPAGKNHMEGGDALAYVRSRHGSAGGDFSRSERQQALLLAIRDKFFSLDVLNDIPKYFQQFIKHTNTDLDIESIKYLAPFFTKTQNFEIQNITLSTENVLKSSKSNSGQYIVISQSGINDWTQVKEYIDSQLNK
ncbi:MAG: LCP family protein [Pseudomonadales bacterium]|nr:LCP family protein [Pseudomonadales bacterium]